MAKLIIAGNKSRKMPAVEEKRYMLKYRRFKFMLIASGIINLITITTLITTLLYGKV